MIEKIKQSIERLRVLRLVIGVSASIVLLFLGAFSLTVGSVPIGWHELAVSAVYGISQLLHSIAHIPLVSETDLPAGDHTIVWMVRAPRIVLGIIIGAGLSSSGATFQSLLMNPLADSYTIGVSSGAAFGATLALLLNILIPGASFPVILFAFCGAALALLAVLSIASADGSLNSINLIIAGIITSSILSSAISLIKALSGEKVGPIIYWLMGNINSSAWSDVLIAATTIIPAILLLTFLGEKINILSLGEDEALSLGVDVKRTRLVVLLAASLITAVCVTLSGIIGFLGLVVPHMLRFLIGADNRSIIPLSALGGGIILVGADTMLRLFHISEIPVGVITTLIGGPCFITIFLRYKRGLG